MPAHTHVCVIFFYFLFHLLQKSSTSLFFIIHLVLSFCPKVERIMYNFHLKFSAGSADSDGLSKQNSLSTFTDWEFLNEIKAIRCLPSSVILPFRQWKISSMFFLLFLLFLLSVCLSTSSRSSSCRWCHIYCCNAQQKYRDKIRIFIGRLEIACSFSWSFCFSLLLFVVFIVHFWQNVHNLLT